VTARPRVDWQWPLKSSHLSFPEGTVVPQRGLAGSPAFASTSASACAVSVPPAGTIGPACSACHQPGALCMPRCSAFRRAAPHALAAVLSLLAFAVGAQPASAPQPKPAAPAVAAPG